MQISHGLKRVQDNAVFRILKKDNWKNFKNDAEKEYKEESRNCILLIQYNGNINTHLLHQVTEWWKLVTVTWVQAHAANKLSMHITTNINYTMPNSLYC